jgi:hypothetical protein
MKTLMKTCLVAAVVAGASQSAMAAPAKKEAAAPAAAAAAPRAGVNGIAIVARDAVLYNSAAFKKAQVDRDVQFKSQLDAAKAKEAELNGKIKPIIDKFQKDRALPGANVAALQAAAQAQVNAIQEQGKAEIEKIIEPVRLSDAYVVEQLTEKRAAAELAAMNENGVTLLLNPEAILNVTTNAYNLSQAVLNKLNALTPSVSITPPAGWLPREVREQQAAAAQAQPASGESR